jgi:hypothetical protein
MPQSQPQALTQKEERELALSTSLLLSALTEHENTISRDLSLFSKKVGAFATDQHKQQIEGIELLERYRSEGKSYHHDVEITCADLTAIPRKNSSATSGRQPGNASSATHADHSTTTNGGVRAGSSSLGFSKDASRSGRVDPAPQQKNRGKGFLLPPTFLSWAQINSEILRLDPLAETTGTVVKTHGTKPAGSGAPQPQAHQQSTADDVSLDLSPDVIGKEAIFQILHLLQQKIADATSRHQAKRQAQATEPAATEQEPSQSDATESKEVAASAPSNGHEEGDKEAPQPDGQPEQEPESGANEKREAVISDTKPETEVAQAKEGEVAPVAAETVEKATADLVDNSGELAKLESLCAPLLAALTEIAQAESKERQSHDHDISRADADRSPYYFPSALLEDLDKPLFGLLRTIVLKHLTPTLEFLQTYLSFLKTGISAKTREERASDAREVEIAVHASDEIRKELEKEVQRASSATLDERVAALGEYTRLLGERAALVNISSGASYYETLEACEKTASTAIDANLSNNASLIDALTNDSLAVKDFLSTHSILRKDSRDSYERQGKILVDELKANVAQSDSLWSSVQTQLGQLSSLAQKRREILHSLVERKQQFEREEANFESCRQASNEYSQTVEKLKQRLELETASLKQTKEFLTATVATVKNDVEKNSDVFAPLRRAESISYHTAFRQYYQVLDDSLTTDRHTLQELRNQLQSIDRTIELTKKSRGEVSAHLFEVQRTLLQETAAIDSRIREREALLQQELMVCLPIEGYLLQLQSSEEEEHAKSSSETGASGKAQSIENADSKLMVVPVARDHHERAIGYLSSDLATLSKEIERLAEAKRKYEEELAQQSTVAAEDPQSQQQGESVLRHLDVSAVTSGADDSTIPEGYGPGANSYNSPARMRERYAERLRKAVSSPSQSGHAEQD